MKFLKLLLLITFMPLILLTNDDRPRICTQ